MNTTATLWKFQTDCDADGNPAVHLGKPTDSRGLRLRAEVGYGWVDMCDGEGWRQLSIAIRKLEARERVAALSF